MAEAAKPRAARNSLYNPKAPGAVLDGEELAANWGSFTQAVYHRAEQTDPVRAFKKSIKNAMSERVPSSGGFLVPEVLRSDMLMVALEKAIVRSRARIIPMDSLRVPYPMIDDTSHTSSVYGGVIGFWTEEAAALSASQPSFGRAVLEAKKLTGYTEVPNELLSDSVEALTQFIREIFPEALAFFEDVGFLSGSGVGQPQGVYNSPCAIVSAARAGGAGAAVQYIDIAGMYARLLPFSLNSAVWLCSPDVLPGLMTMVTASGIAPPLWLSNFSAADGFPGGGNGDGRNYELLGRPLLVTEKAPALSAQGCLALVDFGYYLLGDRQQMEFNSSEDYRFQNDLTAFRFTERVDGRTWIQSAITPENGGNIPVAGRPPARLSERKQRDGNRRTRPRLQRGPHRGQPGDQPEGRAGGHVPGQRRRHRGGRHLVGYVRRHVRHAGKHHHPQADEHLHERHGRLG